MRVFDGIKDFSIGDDFGVVLFKIQASLIDTGKALPRDVDKPLPVPDIFASNDEEYTSGFAKLRKRSSVINVGTSYTVRRDSVLSTKTTQKRINHYISLKKI